MSINKDPETFDPSGYESLSRSANTEYQNTTGSPIDFVVLVESGSSASQAGVDLYTGSSSAGKIIDRTVYIDLAGDIDAGGYAAAGGIIPDGFYYKFDFRGTVKSSQRDVYRQVLS